MSVREDVKHIFSEAAHSQNRKLATLTDDLPLLNSGLDSLCLAIIVANLEQKLGVDPFSSDGVELPSTFGEFVALYENAAR